MLPLLLACTRQPSDLSFLSSGDTNSPADTAVGDTGAGDTGEPAHPPLNLDERIVFRSMRTGGGDIYIMRPDGSSQVRLTDSDDMEFDPALSPDRTQVAYATAGGGQIHIADVETGEARAVTVASSHPSASNPSWSPDGSRLAFAAQDGRLFVLDVAADTITQIAVAGGLVSEPRWSPDGSAFVFARPTAEGRDIYRCDASGKGALALTKDTHDDWGPAWTPDSQQIIFQSTRAGLVDLFIMGADGGEPQLMTASTNNESATVSPDGAWVAYRAYREDLGNAEIVLAPIGGGEEILLSLSDADDFEPDWR